MKKIITLCLFLFTLGIGYSQNAPTTSAPAPIKAAADVISLFSNSYTNVIVDTWRTNWSSAILTDTTIVGNAVKKYSGLDFVGIEMSKPNQININGMDSFEFDLWTPNSTTFKFKLVDFGADSAFGGNNDKEHEITVTPTLNGWNHIAVPIANFTGLTTKANIAQLIFASVPSGSSVVYIDNVMFSKAPTYAEPTVAAPTPTKPAANVISLFSNAYTNVNVDTWRTNWSSATLTNMQIASNDVKKYSGLDFVGIEMSKPNQININGMDLFEFDLWTPNSTTFKFKLVDFGADSAFGGNNDKEHEITVTPTLNGWNHIAVPIANFTGLTTKANIAQLVFASVPSGTSVVYIDNVMFSKAPTYAEPTVAAPTPNKPAANVISLFSNAYTNVNVDTWRTNWSSAILTDTTIVGNAVKKYSGLDFVGIEMSKPNQININGMDSFEFDLWTPNSTTFKFKLVDFGADSAFGGNNDKEHELTVTPTLNGWNHIAVPIANFTGLTTKANIAQLIFASAPYGTSIVYIDNVMFSKAPANAEPTVAAPTPTKPAANVISLFSNAYTNVNVDTWRTDWSQATLTNMQIASNDVKKYSGLDFVGIEMSKPNQININGMDLFEFDLWTPNSTTFKFKLVDFGADSAYGGNNDKEHEITVTPTLNGWNHIAVPIANFTGLTTKANIAQLVFASVPSGTSVVYIDNVMFSKSSIHIDFETGGQGANWTWTTFENDINPTLEIVNNPSALAPNTSTKVAKFTALKAGKPWAGCESLKGDIGKFTLSASNSIVKIMVYKSVISDVGIKFATDSNASSGEIKVANTKINEWEELTFNFSGKIGEPSSTDISQIIIFPDFNLTGRTSNVVVYFDNIKFSAGNALPEPTVAAPTPTKPAANVISLFSNAYTNVNVDTWRTDWSQATLTNMQIASNDVKKYSGLDYVGIEMSKLNQININGMDSFEFDLWTPNSTTFKFKLVDFGADSTYGGNNDTEHEIIVTPTLNGWNHIAVSLSDFTGLTTKANIAQLVFASVPSGSSIAYIDNVLFSKKTQTGLSSVNAVSIGVYPNPANNSFNVTSAGTIQEVTIYNTLGQAVKTIEANNNLVNVDISTLPIGVYTIKTTVNGSENFSKLIKE